VEAVDECAKLRGGARLQIGMKRVKKKRWNERTRRIRNTRTLPTDPVIEAYKKDIDRTLLRQSLKLSVTERFEELMELQRFAEALRNAPTVPEND